jgi:hypothetical protein
MCPSILLYSKLAIRRGGIKRERKKTNFSTESITLVVVHHPLMVKKKTEPPHDIWNIVLVMLTLLAVSVCNKHWKLKPKRNDMITLIGTFGCQH